MLPDVIIYMLKFHFVAPLLKSLGYFKINPVFKYLVNAFVQICLMVSCVGYILYWWQLFPVGGGYDDFILGMFLDELPYLI